MSQPLLMLVLGDQLDAAHGALSNARPGIDCIVMAEVVEEALNVRHNRHKIAFIFSAMRHFRDRLRQRGFEVIYYAYESGTETLYDAVEMALDQCNASSVLCSEPGEYRLLAQMRSWQLAVPFECVEDDRFLATRQEFTDWAEGRKQLRMEYFYRAMRRKYGILVDDEGQPEGGVWNYDSENRRGWREQEDVPCRPQVKPDKITLEILELVAQEFPDHPGNLDQFYLGVTAAEAEEHFRWFIEQSLPRFGRYQDAISEFKG